MAGGLAMNETSSQRARGALVYRGAKEICGAIGVSWKDISFFVLEHGLPAFKIGGGWVALPSDLQQWVEAQRDKSLKK
jgi:hypothetical protein